jgi:hypothetical protein
MTLQIEVKDKFSDKIINILKVLKEEVIKIDLLEEISTDKLEQLKKISNEYKNGNKEDFVELKL